MYPLAMSRPWTRFERAVTNPLGQAINSDDRYPGRRARQDHAAGLVPHPAPHLGIARVIADVLLAVAKNLGHWDTRMVEKYYGHLAPGYIADAIRAGAPRFDGVADTAVVP